jgi:hypothetical protein
MGRLAAGMVGHRDDLCGEIVGDQRFGAVAADVQSVPVGMGGVVGFFV